MRPDALADPAYVAQLKAALSLHVAERKLQLYKPYAKQLEFHAAGATYRERLLLAGNQLGKTLSAGFETAMHLTGRYPAWWQGRVWDKPVAGWAAGVTSEVTRDSVQRLLSGRINALGTGSIPLDAIKDKSMKRGVADAIDTLVIRHGGGGDVQSGESLLGFKSYDQGREKFQAETLDFVWLDEEADQDIYTESLTRTNATDGIVYMTFTPLKGMTGTVKRFLIDKSPGTCVTTMTIDDAGHYTPAQRASIIASYPAHEREARTKGIPTLGSGRIFALPEETVRVEPFQIPAHWVQICGIDFGWNHPSAAVKLAWDRDNDIVYVTAAHRQKEQTPVLFAATVKPWGAWTPWAWPHDGLQHDKGSGLALKEQYKTQGLNMLDDKATHAPAEGEDEGTGGNGVEAGVMDMLDRMQTGRLKVFGNLGDWFEEFRLYHRKDGKIVKLDDDLMSACLHPDSCVITSFGHQRIADLVGTTGYVLSTNGIWAKYQNCRMTRQDSPMVCVVFSDGSTLECTPDHKLLKNDGHWVAAVDSAGIECHNAVSRCGDKKWMKSGLKARGSLGSVSTTAALENSFTGLFGKALTALRQKALTFTTSTAIVKTTNSTTLRLRTANNIYLNTTRDIGATRIGPMSLNASGENQRLEKSFCDNPDSQTSTSCAKMLNLFVSAVQSHLSLKSQGRTGFAQTHANQSSVGATVLTGLLQTALSAGQRLWQTSSNRLHAVRKVAVENSGLQHQKGVSTLSVLRVKSASRSDVYCMEVPETSAFAISNGAVVHNCRYALMMLRHAIVKPKPTSLMPRQSFGVRRGGY